MLSEEELLEEVWKVENRSFRQQTLLALIKFTVVLPLFVVSSVEVARKDDIRKPVKEENIQKQS